MESRTEHLLKLSGEKKKAEHQSTHLFQKLLNHRLVSHKSPEVKLKVVAVNLNQSRVVRVLNKNFCICFIHLHLLQPISAKGLQSDALQQGFQPKFDDGSQHGHLGKYVKQSFKIIVATSQQHSVHLRLFNWSKIVDFFREELLYV